jgi:hypothetical protein
VKGELLKLSDSEMGPRDGGQTKVGGGRGGMGHMEAVTWS